MGDAAGPATDASTVAKDATASGEVHAPDDLASLPELNDDAVLTGVRLRFENNKISPFWHFIKKSIRCEIWTKGK